MLRALVWLVVAYLAYRAVLVYLAYHREEVAATLATQSHIADDQKTAAQWTAVGVGVGGLGHALGGAFGFLGKIF